MELLDGYAVMDDLGIIYYVIGLPRDDGVWVYPKYIPDPSGDRIINGKKYKKLPSPLDAIDQIKSIKPNIFTKIGFTVFPLLKYNDIKQIFDPKITLRQLIEKDSILKELVSLITMNDINILENLGITGSRLLGLNTPNSDIDLIFYGSLELSKRIYHQLKKLRKRGVTKPVHGIQLKKLWKERMDTPIDYTLFKFIEKRKIVQGMFMDYIYSIKLFDYTAWKQGNVIDVVTFEGVILDDSHSMLFPPSYLIRPLKNVNEHIKADKPLKVISYRSRFWEVAPKGTVVRIHGILEKLDNDQIIVINHEHGIIHPLI
jgi:predicted nucleotidyltransferase